MSLPDSLLEKYRSRFVNLISEGEAIEQAVETIPGQYRENAFRRTYQTQATQRMDWPRVVKWKTNCISLLEQIIPATSVHRKSIDTFQQINAPNQLAWGVSTLRALVEDLERGFLDDLSAQIESAMAGDYLRQAEDLLNEGQSGKYDHVPAAVLAGAVLEKALRTLCEQQDPPIAVLTAKGKPKTLSLLIDDLKPASICNEAKAKQLRAWAATRNHAAHGEFVQFNRSDVEQLIQGVKTFLAEYL